MFQSRRYNVFLVLSLVIFNFSCQPSDPLTDQLEVYTDPIARIHALEIDNAKMNDEVQSKSEQLAVLNASVPGGLALGEREKQLEQKESRLGELETRLQEREGSLLRIEAKLKEDRERFQAEQMGFNAEKDELVIQIGQAQQMISTYETLLKEKDEAVFAERVAHQKVEGFVRAVTVAGCVALAAVLIAVSLVVRHRMHRQYIDAAMQTVEYGDLPLAMKEQIAHRLGRELPRLR